MWPYPSLKIKIKISALPNDYPYSIEAQIELSKNHSPEKGRQQ